MDTAEKFRGGGGFPATPVLGLAKGITLRLPLGKFKFYAKSLKFCVKEQIKVIPSVAEYTSALRKRKYKLIFYNLRNS